MNVQISNSRHIWNSLAFFIFQEVTANCALKNKTDQENCIQILAQENSYHCKHLPTIAGIQLEPKWFVNI